MRFREMRKTLDISQCVREAAARRDWCANEVA